VLIFSLGKNNDHKLLVADQLFWSTNTSRRKGVQVSRKKFHVNYGVPNLYLDIDPREQQKIIQMEPLGSTEHFQRDVTGDCFLNNVIIGIGLEIWQRGVLLLN
jgi:hypothetical protein